MPLLKWPGVHVGISQNAAVKSKRLKHDATATMSHESSRLQRLVGGKMFIGVQASQNTGIFPSYKAMK